MNRGVLCWPFLVALALSAPVRADELDQAQRLLDRREAPAAQTLLRTLSPARYGHDERFNALYGRAALETGDAEKALDHLQTALSLDPTDDRARLDLARTLAALGDESGAREAVRDLLAHARSPTIVASARRLQQGLMQVPAPTPAPATDAALSEDWRLSISKGASPASRLFARLGPQPFSPSSDILALRPRQPSPIGAPGSSGGTQSDANTASITAGPMVQWGRDRLSFPVYRSEFVDDQQHLGRYDALGLEWNRRVDADNRLTIAAQRGGYTRDDQVTTDVASVQGLLAWTRELGQKNVAEITGTVFLGDDSAKNQAYRSLGRRFYGVEVEGRMNLFTHHSPYTSLQLRHSDYDGDEALSLAPRREDYARLAAGWDWQILPNWGLRAEANYSFNNSTVDAYQYDRSRLFLSTRFDFR